MPAEAIWLALGSAVIEAIYFVCLSAAYRRGALSLVYPLARGSAPLLAVAVGIFLLGERLAPMALVGVGCLLVGHPPGRATVARDSGGGKATSGVRSDSRSRPAHRSRPTRQSTGWAFD